MSVTLAENVKLIFLYKLSIRKMYAWSDSATVLHWLNDYRGYKTFVSNKFKVNSFHKWKSVSMNKSPGDLESRGFEIFKLDNK